MKLIRKIKKTTLFTLTIFGFISSGVNAQDIHFSQFSQTPLLINPAFTGVYDGNHRIVLNYKNQWAEMGNSFKTIAGSFDMSFFKTKARHGYLGVGINVFNDVAGDADFNITQSNFSLSGIVPINRNNKISAGLQTGAAQRSINSNELQWSNQYTGSGFDPASPSNEANISDAFFFADISAGVLYEFSKYKNTFRGEDIVKINAGIACFHVNRPTQKFFSSKGERLYRKWAGSLQARWDIPDTKLSFFPSAIYFTQGTSSELNFGGIFRYRLKYASKITNFFTESAFSLGFHYRFKDAIITQLYYEIGDYAIGVSYDSNFSSYSNIPAFKSGIEISIKYIN